MKSSLVTFILLLLALLHCQAIGRRNSRLSSTWENSLTARDNSHPTVQELLQRYQSKLSRRPRKEMSPLVWIGSSVPDIDIIDDSDIFASDNEVMGNTNGTFLETAKRTNENRRLARSRNQPLSDEICTTNRHWKQINVTHDIYGHEVEIVHTEETRQFVFVYECVGEGTECSGISHHLQSTCETRTGWVNMLHRKISSAADSPPHWGYVSVPHHCACRIAPRISTLL